MNDKDLVNELKSVFSGDVGVSDNVLNYHSKDASIFKVKPRVVVFPKDSNDVCGLVKKISELKKNGIDISISPRSAGTCMSGGSLTDSVMISFMKYMNNFHGIDGYVAKVEPGMYYRDFEKETLKKGLILPSYTASKDICAVGGMVGNNSGGEKTLRYGKTENYISSLKMVASDGNEYEFKKITEDELNKKIKQKDFEGILYKKIYNLISKNYDAIMEAKPDVSKNSSGYFLWNVYDKENKTFDMTKLIVGSQGTLGIITEISFSLVKKEENSSLLVLFLNDLSNLGEIVNHTLLFKPESFESYDDHTFKIAIKFFFEILKKMKGNFLKLAFDFIPEFFMVLSGGVPKLVLLVEFTSSSQKEANTLANMAKEDLVRKFGIKARVVKDKNEAQKYWVMRRESFNLLRQKLKNLKATPFIDDLVIHPKDLPTFLPRLYRMIDEYKLVYTIAGHAGDANFHIIPLMDMSKASSKEIIVELEDKVNNLVREYHGSLSGEHNDGLIRSHYLPMMFGDKIYSLFEETKKIFDPLNIFNPKKKVNFDKDFAINHIEINEKSS